jgi:hypothetical protein
MGSCFKQDLLKHGSSRAFSEYNFICQIEVRKTKGFIMLRKMWVVWERNIFPFIFLIIYNCRFELGRVTVMQWTPILRLFWGTVDLNIRLRKTVSGDLTMRLLTWGDCNWKLNERTWMGILLYFHVSARNCKFNQVRWPPTCNVFDWGVSLTATDLLSWHLRLLTCFIQFPRNVICIYWVGSDHLNVRKWKGFST